MFALSHQFAPWDRWQEVWVHHPGAASSSPNGMHRDHGEELVHCVSPIGKGSPCYVEKEFFSARSVCRREDGSRACWRTGGKNVIGGKLGTGSVDLAIKWVASL